MADERAAGRRREGWVVVAGEPALAGEWWPVVAPLLCAGGDAAVAASRHAVTWRVSGPGGGRAYLKLYRSSRRARRRARRAVRAARGLSRGGFAVPEILLRGWREDGAGGFAAFVLAREVRAPTLLALAASLADRRERRVRMIRRRVAEALGREIGRLHRLGWVHGDLLAGNVLVEDGVRPRIWLIDHDRTRRLPARLAWPWQRRNLVQLNRLPLPGVGPALRWRALRAYAAERGWSARRLRREAKALAARTRRRREHLRDLVASRMAGGKFHVLLRGRAWLPQHEVALRNADVLLASAALVKRHPRRCVVRTRLGDTDVFVKTYDERGFPHRLEALFTGAAARRALRGWRRLRRHRFGVPDLVAVLEERAGVVAARSAIVTRAEPWPAVDAVLGGAPAARRARLMEELGRWVGGLHRAGLYPQDLRAANVLAQPVGAGWHFVLVDFDRVRAYRRLGWRRRRKNLVQIYRSLRSVAGREGLAAFFAAYRGGGPGRRAERVLREVERAARRKDRRAGRGGGR